ncbi:MAG: GatB/YqeY domain-containing protein, partial [Terracidiphilus sp.]
ATMIDPGALAAQITKLTVEAMKAHNADRTGTLRLIKAALMNKALERNASLTPAEEQQTLTSMIKQRRDSIEQFTNGNRPELAAKEAAEIVIIDEFLPKAIDEAGLASLVTATLAELETTLGHKPGMKDMGPSMKAVQAKLQATGVRADGRLVSELVKKSLAG